MNASDYWISAFAGMTTERLGNGVATLNSRESKQHGF
jgi:hypothetical protein